MINLDIISLNDLMNVNNANAIIRLETALLNTGIVGISDVPEFANKSCAYINAARNFASLSEWIKQKYAPNRDMGNTEGYELGAEWFKNEEGVWQIDDKKASYYAHVPDQAKNVWPIEMDLKSAYLALGELIFDTGKIILDKIQLNKTIGLNHDELLGYGRMLHYHKINHTINSNNNWCGAHVDHGVFTGLIPACYFRDGIIIDEPANAGLYVVPSYGSHFEKVNIAERNIILFQAGEFGQMISNDRIRATKHVVRQAEKDIERFTFALFYSLRSHVTIKSQSVLREDERYQLNKCKEDSISYGMWEKASYDRYRAMK